MANKYNFYFELNNDEQTEVSVFAVFDQGFSLPGGEDQSDFSIIEVLTDLGHEMCLIKEEQKLVAKYFFEDVL